MKRIGVVIAILALVGVAYGQSTQVLSRNAVGYVRVAAAKGTLSLIAHNFVSIDGSTVTTTNLLADQAPANSVVYGWNRANQAYFSENYIGGFGWFPGTNVLERGNGFWLKIPSGAASNSYDIYLMGEVPSETNLDNIVDGITLSGYPYPVSTLWTNTDLAKSAAVGDKLYYWDGSYKTINYIDGFGWFPSDVVIEPGMGFWYLTTNASLWQETKPYTWPN